MNFAEVNVFKNNALLLFVTVPELQRLDFIRMTALGFF